MKTVFNKIGQFIYDHSKLCIGIITVLTILFAAGLPRIQMKMGNDVFVSPNKAVYKDTETYQKHFGGDSLYLILNGSQKDIISHETMQKIHTFEQKVDKVDNVNNTTSVVTLLNSELKTNSLSGMNTSSSSNNSKLQKDLMDELSSKQKNKLQSQLQASLNQEQQASLQQYTLSILTNTQKQKMMQAQQSQTSNSTGAQAQQQEIQKMLTTSQKAKLQSYMMSQLNRQQKDKIQKTMVGMLPSVQDMSTKLLRDMLLDNNGNVRGQLDKFFPKNGKHALVILNTTAKSSDMTNAVKISNDVNKAIKDTNFNVSAKLGGQPAIMGAVNGAVTKDMAIMLTFAIILMVIILMIVFPVRRRLLPLLFVLVCLVWTFGIMGWLNIPLTLATMSTLPIIIGLGTDFGVQFLNRYEEEIKKTRNTQKSVIGAVVNMGPAVGIALIVMALSFLTMFLSKAPLMQKFGLTLAIGVVCSYIVELILIFSTLSIRDRKVDLNQAKGINDSNKPSKISNALSKYAKFVIKHAKSVLLVGAVLGAIGFSVEGKIGVETDMVKMIPQNLPSLQNTKYLQKQIGSTTYITYLVKTDDVKDENNLSKINSIGKYIDDKYKDVQGVTSIASTYKQMNGNFSDQSQSTIDKNIRNLPKPISQTLISKNDKYATIQFKVNKNLSSHDQLNLMNKIDHDMKDKQGKLSIKPAGAQVMMLKGIDNMTANRTLIIIAGLAIIFLVIMLVYRKFKLALYPVVPIVIVLGLSPLTLWLLGTSYNPVTVALSSLVLGIGTEFTILLVERYREEIKQGGNVENSIVSSIQYVGQAITASGLTVMGGFVAIMFASFPVLRSFGLITVLDTGYSLISALTILPAFIYLLRSRKNK